MDHETKQMFNTILEEMGRMEHRINNRFDTLTDKFEKRFERIENRLDSMQHEINACKLELSTVSMRLDNLEKYFYQNLKLHDEFHKKQVRAIIITKAMHLSHLSLHPIVYHRYSAVYIHYSSQNLLPEQTSP